MQAEQPEDARLIALLRDAGRALPGARDDLAAAVAHTLAAAPARSRRARAGAVAVLVAAVVLVAAAVDAIVPGVDLRFGPPAARAPAAPLARDTAFAGTPVTLEEARTRAGFPLLVPAARGLGEPQVRLAGRGPQTRVSLLYGASPHAPALPGTTVGLFVTQFRGDVDPVLLTKVVRDGRVAAVDVAGGPGWWVEGAHEVLYRGPDGGTASARLRYAQSTLLWSRDGVTLRLESGGSREQALAIAASMRRP